MSTQPSPPPSSKAPTPFDDTAEILAPGERQAHAPAPGVGCWAAGTERLANADLQERLVGHVQWLRLSFRARWQGCRRGRRAWVVTAPDSGFGKSHFLNALAGRLDGDAVMVAVGRVGGDGDPPYWERAALAALVHALDRAEAGGALAPASAVRDRARGTTPAIESHWTALARNVLAGAVRELLAVTADRAGATSASALRLGEVTKSLPPDLRRTADWRALLDHVLGKPALLEAVAEALRGRGVATHAQLSTWLNVFHTLLFADDLELRAACRRWIGGRPVAPELCDQMGVDEGDRLALEGDGEIARQQALERIADLSHFAAFYVPFVLCVEHADMARAHGGVEATGRARRPLPREQDPLAQMLADLTPSLAHALLVVALDQRVLERCTAQWSGELQARWRAPVPLQGLGHEDALRLLDARLRAAAVDGEIAGGVVNDDTWRQALRDAQPVNARRFLERCAQRYRAQIHGEEAPAATATAASAAYTAPAPEEGNSPAAGAGTAAAQHAQGSRQAPPSSSFEAAWQAAQAEVGEATPAQVHDALVPLLKALGERGVREVSLLGGDPPLTQLCWQRGRVRYGIAVGVADTRQRWGQLARRALLGEHSVTVCLRLPGEMQVPNAAWPVAASMLERAMSAGRLRVVRLTEAQCQDVAAAALLHEQLAARVEEPALERAWKRIGAHLGWLARAVLGDEPDLKA